MLSGRLPEAHHKAGHVLTLARSHQYRVLEAWALRLLGEIECQSPTRQVKAAESCFQQALILADELEMRPLQAHCHAGLGRVYQQAKWTDRSHRECTTALEMYHAMGMAFWMTEVEAAF